MKTPQTVLKLVFMVFCSTDAGLLILRFWSSDGYIGLHWLSSIDFGLLYVLMIVLYLEVCCSLRFWRIHLAEAIFYLIFKLWCITNQSFICWGIHLQCHHLNQDLHIYPTRRLWFLYMYTLIYAQLSFYIHIQPS